MRKHLGLALRIAFTLACLGYLAATIPVHDRLDLKGGGRLEGSLTLVPGGVDMLLADGAVRHVPNEDLSHPDEPAKDVHLGFLGALKGIRWPLMGMALLVLGINQPFLVTRWKILLDAQGLRLGFLQVLRLHLTGLFFNITMPGQTGGDVVKSYAAARNFPGKGTAAVVTVFLDRAVGMLGLVVLAGTVSTVMALKNPSFLHAAWLIGGILGTLVVGGGLYLSPFKRIFLPTERLRVLPLVGGVLAEVDLALALYRDRKGAMVRAGLCALVNHTGYILMGVAIGRALGISAEQVSLADFVVLIAIVSMIGCIPVSVMGFGIGELAYVLAFGGLALPVLGKLLDVHVPEARALALSLLTRGCLIAWGLAGGLLVLLDRRRYTPPHQ